MPKVNTTSFASLPSEVYLQILSFAIDKNLSNPFTRKEYISFVSTFQSLNSNISTSEEITQFCNEFWWNVFIKCFLFKSDSESSSELEKLKLQIIKKNQLKRKILLARYINYNVLCKRKVKIDYSRTLYGGEEVRIVFLGSGGVGKSSIITQYVQGVFLDEYDPTFEDDSRKQINVDGDPYLLSILDTFGIDEYSALRQQYTRVAQCYILVCSISNERSVDELGYIIEEIIRTKDLDLNDMPIIFAINKMDLVGEYSTLNIDLFTTKLQTMIKKYALLNTSILEVSAKTSHNIDELFERTIRQFKCKTENVDALVLLTNVFKKDLKYLKECKKVEQSQKCSLM